jgi:tRNA G18 (ribose-2'-O)-methylase SpoU
VLLEAPAFELRACLFSSHKAETLAPRVLERFPDVPVYVAPQAVMDRIAGFPIHRGVLSLVARRSGDDAAGLLGAPGPRLVLGLVGLSNHDNVGGLFRSAAAFGADLVLLDQGTCDPLYRKAVRVSVGGALRVPFAKVPSGDHMLELLQAHGFETYALSPAGAVDLHALRVGPRVALLLGAEGPGLPQHLLRKTNTVRISMSPKGGAFDSLNVTVAGSIALHALRKGST